MKHKHLSILLTLLFCMVGTTAFAHDFAVANADRVTIYYVKTSDTEVAVSYGGSSYSSYSSEYTGKVVIPESVVYNEFTYSVTSIGDYAFRDCSWLTSVTIPNSVTSIGNYAFSGCSSLTVVTIPNSVTSIGTSAFSGCSGLTSIDIPNSVTSIGESVFGGCSGLTSIDIPNSVTSIGYRAFSGCSGLTSIDIPNSVTSLKNEVFRACSGLTSVTIGNSVTSIGNGAFINCSGLKIVNRIIKDIASWCAEDPISYGTDDSNPMYYAKELHLFIDKYSEIKDLVIPDGVGDIRSNAFKNCSGLTSITIPQSVTSIGSNAFINCTALKSLILEDSDEPIYFTSGSIGITELYKGRIYSGYANMFPNLKKLTIGPCLKTISNQNLSSYAPLVETLIISEGVESIEEKAFTSLTKLKDVLIPGTVTSIGCSAFMGCTELKTLTLQDNEADLVFDNTGSSANGSNSYIFAGCNIDKLYLGRTVKLKGSWTSSTFTKVTSVEMGHYVKAIPQYMFMNCNLLTDVVFGKNLQTIGEYAFNYCSSLKTLTLPDGLETIETDAFSYCKQLKKLTIPGTVTEMGCSVFAGCTGLRTIILEDGNEKLRVDNTNYCIFDNCRVDDFYLGRTITSSVKKKIITNVGMLEIGDKVKSIYANMFTDCSNMDELKIGRKVESIGERAFSNTPSLSTVYSYNPVPPVIQSNTFNSPKDRLYVPKGCKEAYAAADYWNTFKTIVEMDEEAVAILGDANGDGKVNITDAVAVVDYILGNAPAGFNEAAADVNKDGNVNITDAVAIVDIILNEGK